MIEYQKQRNIVRLTKRWIFDNFDTKITLDHVGQLVSHISPINMQKVMQVFSFLEITKFYLIITKW